MNATLPSNLNTDSNGKIWFPIFPSVNCCQITGGLVSSPCPHVYYFKRAQIWGWQTSIGLDDIANLYIHSLSVAVNEAAVWLAGFSQANRCLHLHVWKDLIWLGSDKMLAKLTRLPSKFEAFKCLLNITCLCIDSWFNLQEGVADFGHKIRWCKSTPSYSLYLRVLSTSTLTVSFKYSFPSSQGSLTHSMVLERKATHSNSSNWCKNTKMILICSNVFQGHVKQPNIHTPIEVVGFVFVFCWKCLIHMLSRHLMSYKNWPLHVLNINRYQQHLIEGGSSPTTQVVTRGPASRLVMRPSQKGSCSDARFVAISFGSQGLRWSCFRSVNIANLGFPVVQ